MIIKTAHCIITDMCYWLAGVTGESADIWLLDRALRWHYMAPTFINYYCQMMIHIGLPQWQFAFTDVGLMPQAKVTNLFTHTPLN